MLAGELIQYTMRLSGVLGVGQTPLDQDTNDAITALTMMLDQWQRRRWIVYRLDSVSVPVIAWQTTYSVGPGGDFNTPTSRRPGTIESAFLRQLTGLGIPSGFPVDYPLLRIRSREEWNAIPLKQLGSWPARFFYDPTLPLGTLYVWPVPIQTFFEVHISYAEDIQDWSSDIDLEETLPPEAIEAVTYNLAARLRANYALPPRQDIVALAQSSLNTLRTNNFAVRRLRMPPDLRPPGRFRNPMGGMVPELNATIPFPVLS